MKRVITRQSLDTSKYINTETGEALSSELPDLAYVVKNTDLVVIDYKSFIVLNRDVMNFLEEVLPFAEIGRVHKLSSSIKSNWNILHNDKTQKPYEYQEIAEDIQYTRNKFHLFMQKMYKASIVYKLKGYWDGVEKTVFILNPHLVKNTKVVNRELLTLFEDLNKLDAQNRVRKLLKKDK